MAMGISNIDIFPPGKFRNMERPSCTSGSDVIARCPRSKAINYTFKREKRVAPPLNYFINIWFCHSVDSFSLVLRTVAAGAAVAAVAAVAAANCCGCCGQSAAQPAPFVGYKYGCSSRGPHQSYTCCSPLDVLELRYQTSKQTHLRSFTRPFRESTSKHIYTCTCT